MAQLDTTWSNLLSIGTMSQTASRNWFLTTTTSSWPKFRLRSGRLAFSCLTLVYSKAVFSQQFCLMLSSSFFLTCLSLLMRNWVIRSKILPTKVWLEPMLTIWHSQLRLLQRCKGHAISATSSWSGQRPWEPNPESVWQLVIGNLTKDLTKANTRNIEMSNTPPLIRASSSGANGWGSSLMKISLMMPQSHCSGTISNSWVDGFPSTSMSSKSKASFVPAS